MKASSVADMLNYNSNSVIYNLMKNEKMVFKRDHLIVKVPSSEGHHRKQWDFRVYADPHEITRELSDVCQDIRSLKKELKSVDLEDQEAWESIQNRRKRVIREKRILTDALHEMLEYKPYDMPVIENIEEVPDSYDVVMYGGDPNPAVRQKIEERINASSIQWTEEYNGHDGDIVLHLGFPDVEKASEEHETVEKPQHIESIQRACERS